MKKLWICLVFLFFSSALVVQAEGKKEEWELVGPVREVKIFTEVDEISTWQRLFFTKEGNLNRHLFSSRTNNQVGEIVYDLKEREIKNSYNDQILYTISYDDKKQTYQRRSGSKIDGYGDLSSKGQPISSYIVSKNGKGRLQWEKEYNTQGNRVKFDLYTEDGKSIRTSHVLEYNRDGKIASSYYTIRNEQAKEIVRKTYWNYNKAGFLTGYSTKEADGGWIDYPDEKLQTYIHSEIDSRGNWRRRSLVDPKTGEVYEAVERLILYYNAPVPKQIEQEKSPLD